MLQTVHGTWYVVWYEHVGGLTAPIIEVVPTPKKKLVK